LDAKRPSSLRLSALTLAVLLCFSPLRAESGPSKPHLAPVKPPTVEDKMAQSY